MTIITTTTCFTETYPSTLLFCAGGVSSVTQAALERKERLRKLALETIDITKDPYIIKNHLGTYECKLCLTVHPNEGNYLAHTQGKRHQSNLGRRAAMEAKNAAPVQMVQREPVKKRVMKIGRPGYKVYRTNFTVHVIHLLVLILALRIYILHTCVGDQVPRHLHSTAVPYLRGRLPRGS